MVKRGWVKHEHRKEGVWEAWLRVIFERFTKILLGIILDGVDGGREDLTR
jgi:hypothetical protein